MEPPSHPDTVGEERIFEHSPVHRTPRAPVLTGGLIFLASFLFYIAAGVVFGIFFQPINPEFYRWSVLLSQIVGVLLPAIVAARRQRGNLVDGLRLHPVSPGVVLMAVIGVLLLAPLLQVLLTMQELFLVPESLVESYVSQRARIIGFQSYLIGAGSPAVVITTFLLMVVTPGICEEFLFRGVIQRNFEQGLRPVHAIILTSLLFSLLHLQFVNTGMLAIIGAYLGFLTWRTGSIIPSMAAHMAFNAMSTIAAYLNPETLKVRRLAIDDLLHVLPAGLLTLALLLLIIVWLNRRYTTGNQITLEQ